MEQIIVIHFLELWQTIISLIKGDDILPKDSQIDNKESRMRKCNGQTPLTAENQNHNPNAKKHSVKRQGYQSQHIN